MQEKSRDSSRGYLIGLSATVFLSFTGILISYLNRTYNLPSLVLAFWRDLSVVLGLLIVFAAFKRDRLRLDRSHWSFFILYGLTLSLFNSMWTFSVQFNGAAIATVLAFSSPRRLAVFWHCGGFAGHRGPFHACAPASALPVPGRAGLPSGSGASGCGSGSHSGAPAGAG